VVLWPTFPAFAGALVLTTLGKYIFDPPMQAYLGDQVPYETRGRILAVTELGWSLAFVVGIPLMGFLISYGRWMSPFWVLSLLGVLALWLLNAMIPKDQLSADARPSVFSNLQKVIGTRTALAGLAVGIFCSAANEVINLVFGVWMEDAFGLQIAALGAAAAVIGLAELGAESMVGIWVDRLGKPRAIGIGLLANSLTALAMPFLGQTLPGALAGLFLFYLTFEFALVSSIPLMTEILPGVRATMMAFNFAGLSLGRALGALIAAPLYAFGVGTSAVAAVIFNLLALLALRRVHSISHEIPQNRRSLV
jgi:DHA1 family inner membrane transport protein